MQLISKDTHIDFMGWRKIAAVFSAILLVISLGSLAVQQLNLGIDFAGGVLVEVGYPEPPVLDDIRNTLASSDFEDAVVQFYGTSTDVLIRLLPQAGASSAETSERIFEALKAHDPGVNMRRVEFVGPQVGEELTEKGGLALLYALGLIFIYVLFRFHWKFSAGAVAALAHDVIITIGFFSLFQLDFDLTVLAAVLAVIGYSLNDTIVVFDRARENMRRVNSRDSEKVMNESVNQTLARTLMTSLTTLLVLIVLFFLGGEVIHGFAMALIVGVIIGTYSSIFVASNLTLALKVTRDDLMPPDEEDDPSRYEV